MSQTTRCPSCQTHFKVVADQLRISDGWVRCGQCNQVFDATESLEAAPPLAMHPDMRLDKLRAPITWVALPVAAQPISSGTVSSCADSAETLVDRPTLKSTGMAGDLSEGESDSIDFKSGSQPDFENTTPAVLWTDFEPDEPPRRAEARGSAINPTLGAERWRPFIRAADVPGEDRSPLAPLAEAAGLNLRVEDDGDAYSALGALELPDASGQSSHADPIPAFHTPLPGGYELPGSDDDQTEDALVFSDLPDTQNLGRADEPQAVPQDASIAAGLVEPAEPDLAHFIAEFTDWQDSRRPEPHMAQDPVRRSIDDAKGRQEPTLEAVGAITRDARDVLPRSAELLDDAPWSRVTEPENSFASSADVRSVSAEQRESRHDRLDTEPVDSDWDDEPEPPEAMEPTFVRHARRRAVWTSWRVRAGLGLAALLLVALLFGQAVVHHRDLLAASFPDMRTALIRLCEPLHCVVRPHRDIGAILVDGSSFNRTKGDRYQFLLTLRNRSALEVQAPVIELTLTDVQDQPVVRRVLTANELNLPKLFQPQQEWSGEIPMLMAPGTTRIAGYRVLAFYND